uniref:Ank1 protein n=1 Tax=Toxoneuron nigriceps polydnavirus TaxID=191766 RepID=Q5GR55_9VIRU|nr:ank1 protein [Toxoneuron nigriceps polydnavirus]
MENSLLIELLGERNELGNNFFHEILYFGKLFLLEKFTRYFEESIAHLLNEKNHEGHACVHIAAAYGGNDAISLIAELHSAGADLNAPNQTAGVTILHQAVYRGDHKLAKWLCSMKNVDLDAQDFAQKTPYDMARMKNDKKMMEILKKNGAKCDDN